MTIFLLVCLSVGFGLTGYATYVLWDNYRRAHVLVPEPWTSGEAAIVSIIVPARNEAHQIRRCLESLLRQDYPALEVIVVDDRSEDATLSILEQMATCDPRLKVVEGKDLPAGWMGKNWAVHQGSRHATGDWLLFTDADSEHHPHALATTIRYALAEQADFITTMPYQVCGSFWEHVVQPVMILSALTAKPLSLMEDETSDDVIAVGQFLVFNRAMYDRIGGHEAVKATVIDDVSLAKQVRRHGGRLRFPLAAALVRVRMYTNFMDLWRGWSKNLFGGANGDWRLAVAGAVVWTLSSTLPWLTLPWYLWRVLGHASGWDAPWGLLLSALCVGLALALRNVVVRRMADESFWWTLTHPLGYLMFSLYMLNSMRRGVLGLGPEWKGRVYPGMHM